MKINPYLQPGLTPEWDIDYYSVEETIKDKAVCMYFLISFEGDVLSQGIWAYTRGKYSKWWNGLDDL